MTNAAPNSSKPDRLQQVGAALDSAEANYRATDDQDTFRVYWAARQSYFQLLHDGWCTRLRRLRDMQNEKDDCDTLQKLYPVWMAARDRFNNLPDTATAHERIDAEMAEARAEGLYEIIYDRYQALLEAQRRNRARASELKKKKWIEGYRSRKAAKQKSE